MQSAADAMEYQIFFLKDPQIVNFCAYTHV